MMMLSDIVWWTGVAALMMYFGAASYILAGVAIAYYRRRK